jgi:hypothetical protein
MTSYCCQCGARLLTAEEVGKVLDTGHGSLTPASARKVMTRAGTPEVRGYSADEAQPYTADRPGKDRWGHK